MTFKESGLTFSFPRSWKVIKWDAHRFFGYVSGRGFKGVDFMALHDEKLYLIEVKNYKNRRSNDKEHPFNLILADPNLYAEIFLQKFSDSFTLIRIIEKYYLRKYFFKFWSQLDYLGLNQLGSFSFFQKFDFIFWTRVSQILRKHPEQVQLILWLEPGVKISTEKYIELKEKLFSYFRENPILPEGVTISINNRGDQNPKFNIKVKST
jgi:hypothetical protein